MNTAPEPAAAPVASRRPQTSHLALISNRNSIRPTPHVTPTKQRKGSRRVIDSNREALRLEIDVTLTKQRLGLGSNREETALLSIRARSRRLWARLDRAQGFEVPTLCDLQGTVAERREG